jgi:uroporphyrinogen decarboxylase
LLNYNFGKPSPRERVIRCLRRTSPDGVPTCSRFTPGMMRIFNEQLKAGIPEEHLGGESLPSGFIETVHPSFLTPDDYFGWEVRHISLPAPTAVGNFAPYLGELPLGAVVSQWGIAYVPGPMHHYRRSIHPLRDMTHPDELKRYPFPDPPDAAGIGAAVDAWHQDGLAVAGFLQQTLFELAWEMRGMEELLVDFYFNKAFAEVLLERITHVRMAMAASLCRAGVDILRLGDDLGTQRALLMDRKTWQEMLKPRLKRIIDAARRVNSDVLIFFHSDGFIEPIIEDLIEIGVDVLNPIQPECMDIVSLKAKFGDQLSFWGGVGTQTTMPFGTPAEVKEEVRRVIEVVGYDGGLLISPSHALQPDVPWENVVSFFEAVAEYGRC